MAERERERDRGSFNQPVDAFFLCATSWKPAKDGSVVRIYTPLGMSDWTSRARALVVDYASDSPG